VQTIVKKAFRPVSVLFGLFAITGSFAATTEFEWARTYRLNPSKLNQGLKILRVQDGIVVAGNSTGPFGDSDYVLIKYKTNGDEAWIRRHGGTAEDVLRDMCVDTNANIFITGTIDTLKYDSAGKALWTNHLAGRAIAATAAFVGVTGLSQTDFETVQLLNNVTNGEQVWTGTHDGAYRSIDVSTALAFTKLGDLVVAGVETTAGTPRAYGVDLAVVKYDPYGTELWSGKMPNPVLGYADGGLNKAVSVLTDSEGRTHVFGRVGSLSSFVASFDSVGKFIGGLQCGFLFPGQMRLASNGSLVVCGGAPLVIGREAVLENYAAESGRVWRRTYQGVANGTSEATSLAIREDQIYSVGYTFGTNGTADLLLFVYRQDGTFVGSTLFDGANHLNDAAVDVAVDSSGSVYATGYSVTPEGGTEILTVKFHPGPKITSQASGAMHIEFHTVPSTPYAIEATSDFFNWQSLITNSADANGLVRFDDLNAATIPYRFYRGKQP
jgi:hypothetical protein